ncbi:3-deoxy-7-phosphoheptulonate synthase [Paraburkholderia sp. Se-20369]|nr:3-deoxy-7-phosphoheptulonate synthase [Paraburkholderia sp. Se-20369]
MPLSDHCHDWKYVTTPVNLKREWPISDRDARFIAESRAAIGRILHGDDDRLLVIVGPCSIHDPVAALDYAARLSALRRAVGRDLEIVMRTYFEKPRTSLGWKGLINDPHLDESHDIDAGLRMARKLLVDVTAHALPVAMEFLGIIDQHYFADCVSWGAIGARTTESQLHREMASGLPCPIGFKNGTDGDIGIAIDAIRAARHPHHFLGVNEEGRVIARMTRGNPGGHLVLRGSKIPNYDARSVTTACDELASHTMSPRVVIDVSHGNSGKMHENQISVGASLAARIAVGDTHIAGVMIESNLIAGRQIPSTGRALTYGQSITDACIGWDDTVKVVECLADAVRTRRRMVDAAAAGHRVTPNQSGATPIAITPDKRTAAPALDLSGRYSADPLTQVLLAPTGDGAYLNQPADHADHQ